MIINNDNKKNLLKGTMKRGFNQDPVEMRNRMHNTQTKVEKEITKESQTKESPEEIQRKIAALKNISRLNKF